MLGFNDHIKPKIEVEVELTTVGDHRYRGKLYLAGDQRVSDLMNLDTPFVPFVTSDDDLLILNKSIIASIQILDLEVAMRHRQAISSSSLRAARDAAEGFRVAHGGEVAEIHCDGAAPYRNEHQ